MSQNIFEVSRKSDDIMRTRGNWVPRSSSKNMEEAVKYWNGMNQVGLTMFTKEIGVQIVRANRG